MDSAMPAATRRIRRARRTDFTDVMRLLASVGVPLPPPERATLHRFRNLVADLGNDPYLAVVDGRMVGLVHVTYARQVVQRPCARLETLVVAKEFRRRGIGGDLLALAVRRARQRGCGTLSCPDVPGDAAVAALFARAGLRPAGPRAELDLTGATGE